jgi:hypothetical protein
MCDLFMATSLYSVDFFKVMNGLPLKRLLLSRHRRALVGESFDR